MDKAGKQQIVGSLGLLTATLLWGFSFVVVKDSAETIPVIYLLALHYLIASVVMREKEARISLDGPEVCREYLETGKITFGSSTLLPGHTGGIDPGHPLSHEVFFVSRGHVM